MVDFGDNVTSIFYWYDVGSLSKLKECIKKRFSTHLNNQNIKYGDDILNEESFQKLYKNRFKQM